MPSAASGRDRSRGSSSQFTTTTVHHRGAPSATQTRGGIWSVRRSRPPRVWVAEGAPRWWTVVVVNWEDEPRDVSLPLAAVGIKGAKFDAYDVWRDAPVSDLKDFTLEPRSARTVAIRPAVARPQVIGTTRHVVQGAVDVADETWDA